MSTHSAEVLSGERFEFGANWSRFLELLTEERIQRAETSLKQMLEVERLDGKRFLDIGSGSGLFSLAAHRLGARVHSFDFDPQSVACTRELKRRFFPGDNEWTIEEASALDADFVKQLGTFDIVYSWGVLHHTGNMWQALANAAVPVSPGGMLFIAIYNDTGTQAARWKWIKKTYNQLPEFLRPAFALATSAPEEGKALTRSVLTLKPMDFINRWTAVEASRGMSHWRDIIDWVGGYPYEYAKPEEIFDFYKGRGFSLSKMKCGGVGLGCNEFVFRRELEVAS
jgi:2-polyprenyl-3-methyl-5-hydroxy-6-metoxy-1,4-benzoquinol methylase